MKHLIIATLLLLSANVMAQTNADKIVGTYTTEGNKGKVTIKKTNDKYFGTLIWTNIPDAKDIKNPDKSKRNNLIAGTVILKNFVFAGNNVWDDGTVYDPESGKTYSGKITLKSDGTLSLRGFVGISAFGRTSVWKPLEN